jgi:glutathione S-transferase
MAVMAGLDMKGLEFERHDLMFGLSNVHQFVRFRARTVPGITIGERKIVGSRPILRALDELVPEPSLRPADPALSAEVDKAEEWGDLVLQEHARWIVLTAARQAPEALESLTAGYKVPSIPSWVTKRMGAGADLEMRLLGYTGAQVKNEWIPALPATLDHVDDLIARGVIGGHQPNVADLQIGSSVRLLLNVEDIRPGIEERPAGKLARRLFPDYPGHIPAGCITSPF